MSREIGMRKITATLVMTLMFGSAFAEDNHHQHQHQPESKPTSPLVLNQGKKWTVDQTMKENMGAIHQKFALTKDLAKSKKVTSKEAQELSALISSSSQNIISKCKMEKKQDEAFHVILGDLLTVANELKKTEKVEPALKKLGHTLKTYTEYFDHPLSI